MTGLSWFRVSINFIHHPKVMSISGDALRTLLEFYTYSTQFLTDGAIPKRAALKFGNESTINELLNVDLIESDGDRYVIHDWHDWQEASSTVKAKRAATMARVAKFRGTQDVGKGERVTPLQHALRTPLVTPPVTPVVTALRDQRSESEIREDIVSVLPVNKTETNVRTDTRRSSGARHDPRVIEVYEFWKTCYQKQVPGRGGERLLLTQKRAEKVLSRLREGYTADDLKNAVRGHLTSEYHLENGYLDIELTCRNAEKVDMFLGKHGQNLRILEQNRTEEHQHQERQSETLPIPGNLLRLPMRGT